MGIARAAIPLFMGMLTVVAEAAPVTEEIPDATVAMGFGTKTRCHDLMQADSQDGTAALVLFVVGPTGVPSRASIKSPSGSASLDSAAVDCVLQLRFLPMVHAGDGNAISSWQEIAWKWGRFHTEAPAAAAAEPRAMASGMVSAQPAAASAVAPAEARVCFDASGRLVQEPAIVRPSGSAPLDAAAVSAARAALPANTPGGCLRVIISREPASRDSGK